MKWNDIYVSASAAWLGRPEDVDVAVAEGRYDAEERRDDDYLSVRVAGDETPADMAVAAAKRALSRSSVPHEDFHLVAHASVGFQGLDHWAPPSYIQQRTVGGNGSAVEVKQASNGGMAAIELAAAYLSARTAPTAALVTTADKYHLPVFDRYRSDKGMLRGDGATAVVLTRGSGVARLLSTAVIGDASHEGVYRGGQGFADHIGSEGWPVDLRSRLKTYLQSGADVREIVHLLTVRQQEVMQTALADAGVKVEDVARFVFPNAGRTVVDWDFRKREFGIDEPRTTWEWGRGIGHIGAGDQAAGLSRLLETKAVSPGDVVVLSGIGAGFTFSCAVLEIVEQPEWDSSTD
ncbi:ketoacyl-ACP synthase III family protein [Streptomyces olivochromogenes]|uniref:ketoacyl-ACP synthase III family protein n=1 Tax=Streptomyces olivochromogenes TaxID=1963 RepID=UPI00367D341B